jgi:uncharacterized protein
MIAGTSTGGILALGLTKRNSDLEINSEPEYTSAELRDFYCNYGRKIFSDEPDHTTANDAMGLYQKYGQKVLGNYNPLDTLLGPKFSSQGRKEVLQELFGDAFMEEALTETLVTSYDIELRAPIFFTSNPKVEETEGVDARKICGGFKMFEAAMATSAAPTFFPPYKLMTAHRTDEGYYALVDGGVLANNPSLIAMMEVLATSKEADKENLQHSDILMVSLGTGSFTRKYKYNNVKKWGQLQWVNPIIDIVLDSQSESVAYQLQNLMTVEGQYQNYYRFQFPLSGEDGCDQMDNASLDNLDYLKSLGEKIIEQKKRTLSKLCDVLKEHACSKMSVSNSLKNESSI